MSYHIMHVCVVAFVWSSRRRVWRILQKIQFESKRFSIISIVNDSETNDKNTESVHARQSHVYTCDITMFMSLRLKTETILKFSDETERFCQELGFTTSVFFFCPTERHNLQRNFVFFKSKPTNLNNLS